MNGTESIRYCNLHFDFIRYWEQSDPAHGEVRCPQTSAFETPKMYAH
jgi:hypothetical protein